ncbi:putative hexose transport-related protein [Filobasidium floriforme]|uniref:putative hexose transport-related protein n=1 Tax=Filobasidium floriforme TaxID=5210 RepID=UPI001E8DFB15|nr:putative hexose transport-related protein [Filobasidium floriforme]KAH8083059.1 putative hexose transport-related protein [Filobasidium floriforme]
MSGLLGALINKKALAETPKEVLNWYLFASAFCIALSGGLHGANTSNISGILAMSSFKQTFRWKEFSASEQTNNSGWITSVIVLGGLVGTSTSAPFNDRLGRKWTMFVNGFLYLVGSIIQISASGSVVQVIVGRAVQGYASGGGAVNGSMFLAEIAPKAIRGLLGAFMSINIMLGVALGYWMNYVSILYISEESNWQWRFPVLFQMYPGIIMCVVAPVIFDSPRWYASRGRMEEAKKTLAKIRRLPEDHHFLQQELEEMSRGVNQEQEIKSATSWAGLFSELKRDVTLRRRFILVLIAQIGFNFSGGNSITYYQSSILSTIGVTGKAGTYLYSGIYGLMKVLAVFVYSLFCAERFGRRTCLLIGSIINLICVLYIAVYLGALAPHHNTAAGWVAVVCLFVFAIGYGIGWAPVAIGLNAEIFPNAYRSKLMSMTFSMQYLVNFLLTRFFPNMVANIGSFGPFTIFACVSALIITYMFLALPEVKGKPMETMQDLFGRSWWLNGVNQKKIADGLYTSATPDAQRSVLEMDEKYESDVFVEERARAKV